ncbi:MAG: hypothetical protein ACTSVV_04355 [Promethearchaeota archaeon]
MSNKNVSNDYTQLILGTDELIMLLNELYSNNIKKFSIIDCLYGFNLFSIRVNEKIFVKFKININDIKIKLKKILFLKGEFPNASMIMDILIRAGFYFNLYKNKFETILNKIENINILEGDFPIAIAFDTNLYVDQYFTQFLKLLKKRYHKPRFPIYFLLSEGVKKELMTFKNKYKNDEIQKLKTLCANPKMVEEFYNQNKLKARIKHMGYVDFLKCNENVYSKIILEDESVDKKNMDSRIIHGFLNEIREQNIKLYLLSQDSDFISRARGNRNLIAIHLERIPLSQLKDEFICSWEDFGRFLYNLAIIFGAINLKLENNHNIEIYGIWRGKKFNNWDKEELKIISLKSLLVNVKKDLDILRTIKLEEEFINE